MSHIVAENEARPNSIFAKSPLKWAGGKRLVLPEIHALLSDKHKSRFIEPFLGSAVVYLNMPGFDSYVLADTNRDLIELYGHIRQHAADLIAEVNALFAHPCSNTSERYYEMREDFNSCPDGSLRRAALFIYLNRHGFNGMCRYNRQGMFNIPYGRQKTSHNPIDAILSMAEILKQRPAQLYVMDFRGMMAMAGEGDTVYLDPPYLPLSTTASFNAYHTDGFGPQDHIDLACLAREAAGRGAHVIISNHDTEEARALYAGAAFREFQVTRSISGSAASRKRVGELLAVFSPSAHGPATGLARAA